jgi:hypothetical protein
MGDVRRLPVGEDNEARVRLDELAREGARRMIAMALEAEVKDYLARFVDEVDEDGANFDVAANVVAGWRARAAVESPSHLRTHPSIAK